MFAFQNSHLILVYCKHVFVKCVTKKSGSGEYLVKILENAIELFNKLKQVFADQILSLTDGNKFLRFFFVFYRKVLKVNLIFSYNIDL